jgi:uncharacterized protein YdeI (YjbR/CyaY-like superfamily)
VRFTATLSEAGRGGGRWVEVEVPPALRQALDGDAEARAAYEQLSFTHRKEYAVWIAQAKREETRERRLGRALEMLRSGVKAP